jgi:hypothetical protein
MALAMRGAFTPGHSVSSARLSVMGTVALAAIRLAIPPSCVGRDYPLDYAYLAQTALGLGCVCPYLVSSVFLWGMGLIPVGDRPARRLGLLFGVWGRVASRRLSFDLMRRSSMRRGAERLRGRPRRFFGAERALAHAQITERRLWVVALPSRSGTASSSPSRRGGTRSAREPSRLLNTKRRRSLGRRPCLFRENFESLVRLTGAIAFDPSIRSSCGRDPFVPRIDGIFAYRGDIGRLQLGARPSWYLDRMPCPSCSGNDDAGYGFRPRRGNPLDYNAASYSSREGASCRRSPPGSKVRSSFYRAFSYRRALPWVYDALVANDTHFGSLGGIRPP